MLMRHLIRVEKLSNAFWIPGLYNFFDEAVALESFPFFTLYLKSSNIFFKLCRFSKPGKKALHHIPPPHLVHEC